MWEKYFEIQGYTVWRRMIDKRYVYTVSLPGNTTQPNMAEGGYYRLSSLLGMKGL